MYLRGCMVTLTSYKQQHLHGHGFCCIISHPVLMIKRYIYIYNNTQYVKKIYKQQPLKHTHIDIYLE